MTIYQKPNESLREWLARYGEVVAATMNITDREALMGALSSTKKITPFKRELNRKPTTSYREFLARAQGYINAEKADANDPEHRTNKNKGTEQGSAPTKQDGKKRQGGGNGDKQPAATTSASEAKKPRFHGDVGHHTNDCADLKDEIERLIREGRLQEFRAERRPRNGSHGGQNDGRRREENQRPEDREPVGVIRTVLGRPYIGGDSRRSQKDYAHETRGVYQERFWSVSAAKIPRYSHTDVAFNEDGACGVHFPHNDALVVEAMIGNHTV
ncbi:uncharacterized protein LOC112094324 [Morus notabilis]|uniref:uncharacterized protein LOC112094324 n=1 Tax=Morus notabilis TaxID=981085 RepID=UPI000CED5E47|nr:uncharacterized protein LOC112094324 [Morus notabilis]